MSAPTATTPPTDPQRLLLEVALQFGATLDLERLVPTVLSRITELFNAERALFALFDELGGVTHALVHNLDWAGGDAPLPVSQGLLAEVMQKGEPVVVADAAQDVQLAARQSVRLLGLRFMIGVPVHGRGRVVGVLYTDSRAEAVRDLSAEVELMTALARLVGTAVENARLFEEQRFRHTLLGKMVHDFRTPLTVMKALGQVQESNPHDPADVVAVARDLLVVTQQMERMMENALELSSIDEGSREVAPTALDLRTALPEHVRLLAAYAAGRGIQIATAISPDLPTAETIAEQVWIVVDNLVFNAIKHARTRTAITLTCTLRDDAGPATARQAVGTFAGLFEREARLQPRPHSLFLEVAVHNLGTPIPAELLPRLFRTFVRGSAATSGVKNTGLGLAIVDQVCQHLGGCVWVESSAAAGTTFRFTLPTDVEIVRSQRQPPSLPQRDTVPLTPVGRFQTAAYPLSGTTPAPRNR